MTSLKYIPKHDPRGAGASLFAAHTPEGIPFRAGPVPVKVSELDDISYSGDFHCRVFDLANENDLTEYTSIMDRAINRNVFLYGPLKERSPQFNPVTGNFVVLLRWVEPYAEIPRYIMNRMGT